MGGRAQLKCDGTRATRFRLSAKRTSPFKSAGVQFSRLLAAEVCAAAVVMLDTLCSEVVWRVLATHSIRQFPLHFPSGASPCAITFQLRYTCNIRISSLFNCAASDRTSSHPATTKVNQKSVWMWKVQVVTCLNNILAFAWNHKRFQPELLVSYRKFEPGPSRTRSLTSQFDPRFSYYYV